MKLFRKRSGFTLVEVNLAIFIMAVGVLSMCSLYSLGFRENSQSVEDVNATAYADACLAPLVAALSSTQLSWEDWTKLGDLSGVTAEAENSGIDGRWPAKGWRDYIDVETKFGRTTYRVKRNCTGIARTEVYSKIASRVSASGVSIGSLEVPSGYHAGLVLTRRGAVVQIAFRLARRAQSLMSQPVFVAEVHYQGGFKQGDVQ